jgi:hypothetical protein
VELTFKEIRKIVVNNRSVGKKDISRILFTKMVFKRITKATAILKAKKKSNKKDGNGIMKKRTAASI